MNSEAEQMIAAIDTNILLDVLIPNPPHLNGSLRCLKELSEQGRLIISEMVFAELSSQFETLKDLCRFLAETSISLVASPEAALYQAGAAWKKYATKRARGLVCPACGHSGRLSCPHCGRELASKTHVLSDFLIGAHAVVCADRLVTRDRGFYRSYFERLEVVDPAE